jgi:hypothetical protein
MRRRSWILSALTTIACIPFVAPAAHAEATGADDVTVVAIIDSGFTPYHWDYLASKMPQATNSDPSDDLPLTQPPDTWIPGFPSTSSFASYQSLNLTLNETDPDADPGALDEADAAKWDSVQVSSPSSLHYYWFPGTKVIGAMTFAEETLTSPKGAIHGPTTEHGTGTTSVAVGNIHGTCPECVLLFIQYGGVASGEAAIDWAMSQPWIDVISNSYGFHWPTSLRGTIRPQLYNNSNNALQKAASDRGQTVFFSAGNGIENGFTIPQSTYTTSQKGPDWIVTVGATSDDFGPEILFGLHGSYTGTGKPVDVAAIGNLYPSAFESTTVSGSGEFGFNGTSNATPVVAGIYSRALYLARRDLAGVSKTQSGGVVATGGGFTCAAVRPNCELADGELTAPELRTRLFRGAVHTPDGMIVGALGVGPAIPPIGEDEFLNEGHGTYIAREHLTAGDAEWLAEFDRVIGPIEGRVAELARPDGEKEWMIVDSWCRQLIWGPWTNGYYTGQPLPAFSTDWPIRSAIEEACPLLPKPPAGPPLL